MNGDLPGNSEREHLRILLCLVCVSDCLSVCLFVCLSVCLSVCSLISLLCVYSPEFLASHVPILHLPQRETANCEFFPGPWRTGDDLQSLVGVPLFRVQVQVHKSKGNHPAPPIHTNACKAMTSRRVACCNRGYVLPSASFHMKSHAESHELHPTTLTLSGLGFLNGSGQQGRSWPQRWALVLGRRLVATGPS